MAKKRTFGFDEFKEKSKMNERIEEIGFRHIPEYEETTTSVDDLGEGEKIDVPSDNVNKPEEAPATVDTTETPTNTKSETETLSEPIDIENDRGDISVEEVKLKTDYISSYIKNLSTLISNADKVKIDAITKKKIQAMYNLIQGI